MGGLREFAAKPPIGDFHERKGVTGNLFNPGKIFLWLKLKSFISRSTVVTPVQSGYASLIAPLLTPTSNEKDTMR